MPAWTAKGFDARLLGGDRIAVDPGYGAKPLTPAYNKAWIFTSKMNF
jgi:hypothetical protein